MQPTLLETRVPPNGVAPVGVAAVDHDVALLEMRGEIFKNGIDDGAGRNVKEDRTRSAERFAKTARFRDAHHARIDKLLRRLLLVVADHATALLQRLRGQIAADVPEANNPEFFTCIRHFRLLNVLLSVVILQIAVGCFPRHTCDRFADANAATQRKGARREMPRHERRFGPIASGALRRVQDERAINREAGPLE